MDSEQTPPLPQSLSVRQFSMTNPSVVVVDGAVVPSQRTRVMTLRMPRNHAGERGPLLAERFIRSEHRMCHR
jgi:hypothetical protein